MALDFFAGCLGGCAGTLVGHPFDTIKVHLQTQDHRNPKYKGNWDCLRKIIANESIAGVYRGMSSPIIGVSLINAVIFGVYGETQRHIPNPNSLTSCFISGAIAGFAQSPICSLIELAKTRMQLSSSTGRPFRGPLQFYMYTYKHEGLRGLFKGLNCTFMREIPSFGLYFLTYETLMRNLDNKPVPTIYILLAGGLAGTCSWVTTYPIDVIKSRIQANGNRYAGIYDCFRQSVRKEGYSVLYKGISSTVLRAFPMNAVTFTVVNWTFKLFGEDEKKKSKTTESIGDYDGSMVVIFSINITC
ncbi:mitochondrial basic amino acids transporter-like isoform X3 [Apis laboriosa]|uniref:mitochondrial basic amino acids transporter-like isoform X3 n=1 Tax=Apis laboriosa TaxID=183418 RepID=UPI001CC4CCF4|nr:mitochondrial basic amino acids transporter-like isoform X3 [Apis laboriosa]